MYTAKVNTQEEKGHIHSELHSQFIEFLGSCIYDGIWVGEDSQIPNYKGMRKDVVDALKKIEPPVIRWPGGCYADTYHWRDGIGRREERPVTYNENFGTYERDENQFGTHEFMELCRMVGARPWLNINMLSGSVREMKEWMEYCNRQEETTLSKEREANGSKEPFYVELWGIGNEVWAGGGNMTAEDYALQYRKYATAFPNFAKPDGSTEGRPRLKRIACGPDGNKPGERKEWTKRFFKSLGEFRQPPVDGYDLHFYNWNMEQMNQQETEFDEKQWDRVISGCLELESVIKEQVRLIEEGIDAFPEQEGFDVFRTPRQQCDLIVGEWGNWHGSAFANRPALYQQCTMRDAITTALTLDIFHRNCNSVKAACVAQTVNVLNSLILTEGENCILTPNYDVFAMYKVHREAEALVVQAEEKDEKIFAFASRKGRQVQINLVNTDMKQEKQAVLKLTENAEFISGKVLCSNNPHDYNTAREPDKVRAGRITDIEIGEDGFQIVLPAASVQVYCFRI